MFCSVVVRDADYLRAHICSGDSAEDSGSAGGGAARGPSEPERGSRQQQSAEDHHRRDQLRREDWSVLEVAPAEEC